MRSRRTLGATVDPGGMVAELMGIADYIAHLRTEIGALRANELTHDRIPMAHEELGNVLAATAGATNTIMEVAESILSLPDDSGYRAAVETGIGTIFEACAFQDITGQRIGKVVTALQQLEVRLARFASAVRARDAAGQDPAEAERAERARRLILNGPQLNGPATAQDDIDAMFA